RVHRRAAVGVGGNHVRVVGGAGALDRDVVPGLEGGRLAGDDVRVVRRAGALDGDVVARLDDGRFPLAFDDRDEQAVVLDAEGVAGLLRHLDVGEDLVTLVPRGGGRGVPALDDGRFPARGRGLDVDDVRVVRRSGALDGDVVTGLHNGRLAALRGRHVQAVLVGLEGVSGLVGGLHLGGDDEGVAVLVDGVGRGLALPTLDVDRVRGLRLRCRCGRAAAAVLAAAVAAGDVEAAVLADGDGVARVAGGADLENPGGGV